MSINKRAIVSGALGASASLVGKLALSPDSPLPLLIHSICQNFRQKLYDSHSIASDKEQTIDCSQQNEYLVIDNLTSLCPLLALITRGLCLLLMIGLNAIMITSFLDGMKESGSVVGTALSNAANFTCSAIYGRIFFKEYIPVIWFVGATFIAMGMWLLSSVALIET